MTSTQRLLCPFCSAELDEDLYNGTYGCDSGCEYIQFSLACPACGKVIYNTGAFGHFGDAYEPSENEYRQEFLDEWAAAVETINAERVRSAG